MSLSKAQQPLVSHLSPSLSLLKEASKCRGVWDPREARFEECFLPVISLLPGLVAIIALLIRVARPLSRKAPQWLKPFVVEYDDGAKVIPLQAKQRFSPWAFVLLICSTTGFALDLVNLLHPRPNFVALLPTISWATVILLVIVDRPKAAPISTLVILLSIAATQLTLQLNDMSRLSARDLPNVLAIFSAFGAIAAVSCMPFRSPELSSEKISVPFDPPSSKQRSPEDLLTPWQFLSVAWMNPLISIGSKRQLNEEDVWSLGYQFQHKGLHERFRELKGSVIRRLLAANGIDLVILTGLGLLETISSYAAPALLQQLLRSMEDFTAPQRAAIVYAVLQLAVRIIKCQSSVISIWYGRRCYERSRGEMITMLHEKVLARKIIGATLEPEGQDKDAKKDDAKKDDKQPASMGKILNLMRNDVYEVSQRFWDFQQILTVPLNLILSVVFVWKLIGWPCLLGCVTVLIAQGINVFITRILLRWERKRRAATDDKLQKTSQFVEAIRHLRWYSWQELWLERILDARQKELAIRVRTKCWRVLYTFFNTLGGEMFPVAAFYAYTSLAGLPLRIDIAFPALQLFGMLQRALRRIPDLITTLLNAKIAVNRIEAFMAEPDNDSENVVLLEGDEFLIENASFSWPGRDNRVLHDVSLSIPPGLTVILGEVASGKTALLQAMLGEMDTQSGQVKRPKGVLGYCEQSPWLQSMSIKDNILFSSPLEEDRYRQVLEACALSIDIASFKDRDLSLIGENGIGLSGGQRARVALARAVYSRAPILLLDDPLSALDHQTAESIVRNCFKGPLVQGRTVILVTHRLDLCQDLAQQMIEVSEGRVKVLDQKTDLNTLSLVRSRDSTGDAKKEKEEDEETPDKFLEDEKRVHGGVKLKIYWEFIKAGKFKWWALTVLVVVFDRIIGIGESWFLKEWGEAYNSPSASISSLVSGPFKRFPSPEANVNPWLLAYFGIAMASSVMTFFDDGVYIILTYTTGKTMFNDIMQRVAHATFRFYDVTPVGRLMNRLTSDIGTIDGSIAGRLSYMVYLAIAWLAALLVIASVTPVFLVFSVALSVSFIWIFKSFLPTSQSLRRLEMVSLSPLMSNFGALLHGLTTVRAFRAQSRFQDRVIEVTDAFQKMDHFYWSLQSWLSYRFDTLAACSTFILTLLALYTGVSPGLTAFVLISAGTFVSCTHSLCKMYGSMQMDFVSVERVVELMHLDQEPPGTIAPPASWPSYGGDIVFNDVTIKYAPHLEPSLHSLSFCIPGGSTTALLGRTGSGKSTLALSLLATILPTTGTISIDGIDVSKVNTQALRHRLTFLAQDPVLFPGSMRENLDPLKEHTDEECDKVLQRVCAKHQWKLDTQIDTGGKNLSQGQRQLVGLTRAVLRRSSIIILDEATASIDTETAMTIQQILREEMRESTVITIAHRLEAVKNADFYIRLDHGRIIGQGAVDAGTMGAGGVE